jgi:hypothetical protein
MNKLPKNISGASKSKKVEYSRAINSFQDLRKYNIQLVLGHGEISAIKPFFKVPENKMVVMFVKVGCELGDTSTPILWDAIATDPDRAYIQKVLLTPEEAMSDDFLFKYKLIYPAGSYCPNVYTTLACMSGMKSGVFDQKQIREISYKDLPCVASIHGKEKITTEDIINHSKKSLKEIYVSYTCLFLRGVENPFSTIDWGDENITKEHIKAVLDCASSFSSQAQEIFLSKYDLFPIKYIPSNVIDKPGVTLKEYDKKKYHELRIYKVFESKGSNFWEKTLYYTGLKNIKEKDSYNKYMNIYNSICGEILLKNN